MRRMATESKNFHWNKPWIPRKEKEKKEDVEKRWKGGIRKGVVWYQPEAAISRKELSILQKIKKKSLFLQQNSQMKWESILSTEEKILRWLMPCLWKKHKVITRNTRFLAFWQKNFFWLSGQISFDKQKDVCQWSRKRVFLVITLSSSHTQGTDGWRMFSSVAWMLETSFISRIWVERNGLSLLFRGKKRSFG